MDTQPSPTALPPQTLPKSSLNSNPIATVKLPKSSKIKMTDAKKTLFSAPTDEQLDTLTLTIESNLVPSQAELEAIAKDWKTLGLQEADFTSNAIKIAWFCYHSGSSESVQVQGNSTLEKIPLYQLAGVVRQHSTLRRFCRYFAKIIWNYALRKNQPPANWASQNYKEADKFAAFDFFEGVSSSAALPPPGGLIREPSPNERMANETNKNVHLYQTASRGSNLATTSTVATKGAYSTNASNAGFLITGDRKSVV